MPRMTDDEQKEFLQQPGILMRIATVREDGSPLVTPIWFIYEDDCIWFTPRQQSEWFSELEVLVYNVSYTTQVTNDV